MLKLILIYLWIFIAIHGTTTFLEVKAGDAEEHVHIKLHMPKAGAGVRKSLLRNHIRHKKNTPPQRPPLSHGGGGGPGASAPVSGQHNYLTAMGGESQSLHGLRHSNTHHSHHAHSPPHHHQHYHVQPHIRKLPGLTHLQAIAIDDGGAGGGGQQQLLDAHGYYASAEEAAAMSSGDNGAGIEEDYMAYLTNNFASFPQPTFETEFISASPMANSELAYHHHNHHLHHPREAEEDAAAADYQHHHHLHEQQPHYTTFKHSRGKPYDEMAVSSVVAAENHELDEDNEILGPMGRTSSSDALRENHNEWTPKLQRGEEYSPPKKSLKNTRQQQQQQHLYPDMENTEDISHAAVAAAAGRYKTRNHYRNDKLQQSLRDDAAAIEAYEEMELDKDAHRYGDGEVGDGGGGIKPLTVDDIWSQLQRTYLSKYTPQAQPHAMHHYEKGDDDDDESRDEEEGQDEQLISSARKRKRSSQKHNTKTRKRLNHSSKVATVPTAAASTVKTVSYENNYYGKPSTFYDIHTPQTSSYGSSFAHFSPYSPPSSSSTSYSTSYSSSNAAPTSSPPTQSPAEREEFYKIGGPAPSPTAYQNFKSFSNFDDNSAAGHQYHTEDEEDSFGVNSSSEESSVFTKSKKSSPGNSHRSHRHSSPYVAYGHSDNLNYNPFNYHDLYASYSTPIAEATIATTHPKYQVSTYHPSAQFKVVVPTPSSSSSFSSGTPSASALLSVSTALNTQTPQQQQQQELAHHQQQQSTFPTGHESTSYQWREQQHYPALYQSYNTASSHQQQQQQQKKPLQYQSQTSNALRLPKATVASAGASSSSPSSSSSSSSTASLTHHHQFYHYPLASSSSSSSASLASSSSPYPQSTTNDFATAAQHKTKKRKNRLKSKRNRIVVV